MSFDVRELARDDRTHVRLYTDPEVLQKELEKIFYRTWVYVGHDSEVPQIGDYKTTFIGEIPVMMVRDKDNNIQVLVNRCMHRGVTVCNRETGNTQSFTCPYHAWEYGLDGTLLAVGMPRGYNPGEIDKEALGLRKPARVERYRGFVFASFAADGISLQENLGPARRYIDAYCDLSPTGEIVVGQSGVYKHFYRGNWKIQLEGSVEGYHAPFTHATAFDYMIRKMNFPNNYQDQKLYGMDLGHGHNVLQIYSLPDEVVYKKYPKHYIDQLVQAHGLERALYVLRNRWNLVLFPNMAILEYQIREIRPISIHETEVRIYHTLLKDAPDDINARRVHEHQFFYGPAAFGGPDDYVVFDRMQEGYKAKTVAPWVYLNRGILSEAVDEEGVRLGGHTQETQQRAPYYEYRRLMAE